ncbi:hypothetical protein E2542_SST14150 [Spatholobus suberectus]|nr:hypothetical protein E2542_SST14150 [Spatholobus suberectus]
MNKIERVRSFLSGTFVNKREKKRDACEKERKRRSDVITQGVKVLVCGGNAAVCANDNGGQAGLVMLSPTEARVQAWWCYCSLCEWLWFAI